MQTNEYIIQTLLKRCRFVQWFALPGSECDRTGRLQGKWDAHLSGMLRKNFLYSAAGLPN